MRAARAVEKRRSKQRLAEEHRNQTEESTSNKRQPIDGQCSELTFETFGLLPLSPRFILWGLGQGATGVGASQAGPLSIMRAAC